MALILIMDTASAQYNNNVIFDYIKPPGTLYNNPINEIKQDKYGLIWFCSNDGLHRYDGYEIITYRNLSENHGYGLGNSINSFYLWNDSTIYIGTQFGGFLKFNSFTKQYESISFEHKESYPILQLVKDGDGTLWLNCGQYGLFFLSNTEKGQVVKQFSDFPIKYIAVDDNRKLHISSGNKIFGLNATDTIAELTLPTSSDNLITSFAYFDNELWIGTSDRTVFIEKEGILEKLELRAQEKTAVTGFVKSNTNDVWILTNWDGIFIKSGNKIRNFRKEFYIDKSLSSNICLTATIDHTGAIWIGTANGINKYDKYQNQIDQYFYKPYDTNSLSDNMVRGIYEDFSGNLWICTNDNFINILNKERTNIKRLKITLDSSSDKIIPYAVYQIDKNNFLVGTSAGLLDFNFITKEFSVNQHLNNEILSGSEVRQIVPFKKNQVLCLAGGKVFLLDLTKGYTASITNLISDKHTPIEGYQHDQFRVIYTAQDEIWLGSYGIVARVSSDFSTVRYYPFEKWRGHMVLYIDKIGNTLWVGTFNGGLIKLDIETGQFNRYTSENGLKNNVVYAAIPDSKGHLWLSTNNGISQFTLANESFTNYSKDDGLLNEEFNRLAFLETSDEKIVFGGLNGVSIFDPKEVGPNPKRATAQLLELMILSHKSEESNDYFVFNLVGQKKIELPYNYNFLQFKYFTDHYMAPEKNQFLYTLENYDEKWINAGTSNTATYTGLAPGTYMFKVKGINPNGLVDEDYDSVIITIRAPFWKQWWFVALITLSLLAMVFVAIKRRVDHNVRVKNLLESEINRRTVELKKSKEELTHLNSKKDFIFSILSHDLRSPLTTLEGFLGALINNYDLMSEEDVKKHAITIKNSVANSLDLIDNTLYWSLSQMGNISHSPIKMDLTNFVQKVYNLYELTAQRKKIIFEEDIEEGIFINADENMVYIVIRNLVSNAIKFTGYKQRVIVKLHKSDGKAIVSIIDEGSGIRPENMATLFDQNYTHREKGTFNEKGTGLGLILCQKFTHLNNGRLLVESEPGKGSTFTVQFPLA